MPAPASIPAIRPATVDDAAALATLGERTYRDTFAAYNDPDDMEAFVAATFSESLQRAELFDVNRTFFVAESGGALVAFAHLVRGAVPECIADTSAVELLRFYVDSRWHGTGLAQRLMERCLEHVRASKTKTLFLGVWERNPRAIRFYEAQGYQIVGRHIFMVGSDPQQDYYMSRSLIDRARPEPPRAR
jgi:diamine N-acetyltransferase